MGKPLIFGLFRPPSAYFAIPDKITADSQTRFLDGGADRNRTCDLLIANETLYQLSYDPIHISRK